MSRIKIAIAGVGNCASSLVQGLEYYRLRNEQEIIGLMRLEIGGWRATDIDVVAAFDVDERKVGRPVEEAIFARPNCTKVFQRALPVSDVVVQMAPVLDGIADHMDDYDDDEAFRVADAEPVNIAAVLTETEADVLLCYLPVGSEQAVKHYAEACLTAGVAMVNCVPVFIASDPDWAERFCAAGVPIVGDDIKSQIGATIVHRSLARLFNDRGVSLDRTYQINTGGNTDFLNMLQHGRLKSKKKSKTEAVQSQLDTRLDDGNIHISPSDYVPWQNDNKVAFIRLEGRGFGDVPLELELRLSVQDSPNSAGVVIDALRCAKLAKDRGKGGPIEAPSAYFMKSPPIQMRDSVARDRLDAFIGSPTAELPVRPTKDQSAAPSAARAESTLKTALILAAGMGSRLYPNASLPKPLAPVHGLTMAEWVVTALRNAVGIKDFVVSVGHEAELVESHFKSIARRKGLTVRFVQAADWEAGNGASALAAAEAIGDAPFILTMCDHLYDESLPAALAAQVPVEGGMLLAVDFDKAGLFDVDDVTKVKVEDGRIAAISKTLEDWDGSDTGVMHCTAGLFRALREATIDGLNGLSDGLTRLAADNLAGTVDVSGAWWLDVDTPEALAWAEHRLAQQIRLTG